MKRIYIIPLIVCLFIACNNNKQNNEDNINNDYELDLNSEEISKEQSIKKVFFNIPSPIVLINTLLESEHTFNSDLLNNTNNVNEYNSSVKMAINFGVYGADLCYCRTYEQIQETINYLATIRILADNLQIPEQAGTNTMDRIENNLQNKDSVFFIINDAYAAANSYFKEIERDEMAAYILVGGWVESMFLAINIAAETNNKDIINRIAEEKFSLENLMLILNDYYNNDIIKDIIPNLKELTKVYNNVEITYEIPSAKTKTDNGQTTIDSKSNIKISGAQINQIYQIVNEIRKIIIS